MEQLSSPSIKEWSEWLIDFSIPASILLCIVLFTAGARNGNYVFKCILAPVVAFVGLFVLWVGLKLEDKFPKLLQIGFPFKVGFILLLVSALVCSVLGLMEYLRLPKHSSKRHGGRYAVITGLICVLALSTFLASLYTKKVYNTKNPIKAFTQLKPILRVDLGFRMYLPKNWNQVTGAGIKPAPVLALTQMQPPLSFALVVQKPGPETPKDIRAFIGLAQAQVLAANTSAKFNELAVNPDFAVFESQVIQNVYSYFYVHRLIMRNGFTYQLITWGPSNDPNSIRSASELMSSKFAVLAR